MARSARRGLVIPRDVYEAMVAHCRMDDPLECCGILGGVDQEVSLFYPLSNSAASETYYNADPADIFRTVRDLRTREAAILAIYHSHPRWPAVPSKIDLATNHYGDVPRIIVSLLDDPPTVRVWKLEPDSYEELAWSVAR